MRRLLPALGLLAVVIAAVVVVIVLFRDAPQPQEEIVSVIHRPDSIPKLPGTTREYVHGGVYAGVVVDDEGQPVVGATVLLVAWETGQEAARRAPESADDADPAQVVVLDYRTAAEGRTDAAGRFRVAADAYSAIRMVAAWHPGYVPSLVSVEKPAEGIRIQLQAAGNFVGTVVNDETDAPVVGAHVALYLQQRTSPVAAAVGETATAVRNKNPLSPLAVAQRWVAHELGPRVWGVRPKGDEALHMYTDRSGQFLFGPIGDAVQLEFVITHPDYMWTEFDQTDRGTVERTLVHPGETVERTFRMQEGKSISGRVLDHEGRGVPDVVVVVEHVSQYKQHWKYRTTARRTRTRRDGGFRVGGLSYGPWPIRLEHPSFGQEHVTAISEEDAARGPVQLGIPERGAIHGVVEGLAEIRFRMDVRLVLDRIVEGAAEPERIEHRARLARKDGSFLIPSIRPGKYRAWVRVEGASSQPQKLEVVALQVTEATFPLGGGGAFELTVLDSRQRILDPATAHLISVVEGGMDMPLGRFISRGGRILAQGVVPGRYRLEVQALGYLPERTEPFTVDDGRRTDVGDVFLREPAGMRIVAIEGPDGRSHRGVVHVLFKDAGSDEFRPLRLLGGTEVPIQPGAVTVQARDESGLSFLQTYEVKEGERLDVRIRLTP